MKKIKKSVTEINGFKVVYIDMKDIPVKYKQEFSKWMKGQTVPFISKKIDAIYTHDWERWIESKEYGTPLIFD